MTVRSLRMCLRIVPACSWIALTLAGPTPALAATEAAGAGEAQVADDEIIVIGTRLIGNVAPERELDEEGINSYGQSTIDELLSEVRGELGDEEEPLVLVNGERVGAIDDIGGLPVEALSKVEVLPRGTAVRAGGSVGQRVVNLTLKKQVRSATLLVAPKISTDGDWHAERGEATLTYIRGNTRANVTFKARSESSLLESDRDIDQPEPFEAFAIGGNVVGFPDTSDEIDPLLSAAAGEIVTVAPIPGTASPTLTDFAADANDAAVTDLGEFRTLRPKTRNYDLNGTFTTRLAPWLTGTAGFRLGHSTRRSLRGLPSALFILSPTNASSPFSTTVALAEYGTRPLETRSERDSGEVNVALNGRFGQWTGFLNARHNQSTDETQIERRATSGNIALADSVDAFGSDLFGLVEIRTNRTEATSVKNNAKLSFTGPLVTLPAGAAQATVEGEYIRSRLHSESDFSSSGDRHFRRTESSLRGALDVPLTSPDGFGGAIGALSATGEYSAVHYSDIGHVSNHRLGLAWEPRPVLRLTADIEVTNQPPSVQTLGNPVIITSDVRTFDPLTGDTVDVTQITGGNPDLRPEKTTVRRVTAVARLVEELNLQLNAEYTDTKERNFVSSLPEASAAVMLAFPERFVRDLDGVLTTVDLRPVNFDSHRERRFRYGVSLSKRIGGGVASLRTRSPAAPATDDDDDAATDEMPAPASVRRGRALPPTRISLTANHSIIFADEISIRPGLDMVDLLDGGAIGLGGGRVRHQVDATASISSGGTGLRVNANWRGKSELNALNNGSPDRLVFSPVFNLSLRAFADLQRFLPHSNWARKMRLSLNVQNVTNDRQSVRDSAGNTPLQYQPGYRDPLGRTIEFEIRKVF